MGESGWEIGCRPKLNVNRTHKVIAPGRIRYEGPGGSRSMTGTLGCWATGPSSGPESGMPGGSGRHP